MVGRGDHGLAVGDHDHGGRAAPAAGASRAARPRSRRRGARSARRAAPTAGPRAAPGPGRGAPARRPTGRPRPRRAPCRGRRARLRTSSPSATCRAPPTRRRRSASGRPTRRLSARLPATSHGRCGSQATCRCQDAGSAVSRSSSPTRTLPSRTAPLPRLSSPSKVASSVDLPQPDGPVTAVSPGAGKPASIRVEGRRRAVRRRSRSSPRTVTGRGPLAGSAGRSGAGRLSSSLVADVEGRDALGGGVELRADPAQRPVRLGGEQQHDQRGPEVEVDPAASRRPTVTATSATDRVATSSSTADDANASPQRVQRGAGGSGR